MKKEKIKEVVPVEEEVVDKSIVSSKEVEVVVNGDEKALTDQIERIKSISKEQELQMIEEEKQKAEAIKKSNELKKQEMERVRQIEQQRALKTKKNAELNKTLEEKKRLEEAQKKKEEEEKKARELASVQTIQVSEPVIEKTPTADEDKKVVQVEIKTNEVNNSKEPSPKKEKAKRLFLIIFFIAIFSMLYFMDYVNKFISDIQARNAKEEVITTGKSVCELKKSTAEFDISITATFQIVNSKLTSLTYLTVTNGDAKEDKNKLEKLYTECINLRDEVSVLDGVTISCSSNNGVVNNKQIINYEKIDKTKVTSAYTEAGGVYPEFKKGQNIDEIESKMTSSGYKCSRE